MPPLHPFIFLSFSGRELRRVSWFQSCSLHCKRKFWTPSMLVAHCHKRRMSVSEVVACTVLFWFAACFTLIATVVDSLMSEGFFFFYNQNGRKAGLENPFICCRSILRMPIGRLGRPLGDGAPSVSPWMEQAVFARSYHHSCLSCHSWCMSFGYWFDDYAA